MNGCGDQKPRLIWALTLLVVFSACSECPCHYVQGENADAICSGGGDLTHAHSTSFCCELCDSSEGRYAVTKQKIARRSVTVLPQGRPGQLHPNRAISCSVVSPDLKCLISPDLDDLQTRLE